MKKKEFLEGRFFFVVEGEMNKKGQIGIIIFGVVIIIVLAILFLILYVGSKQNSTITIKEKWVKYQGSDAKYLVSSTSGEVYQITDTLLFLRYNSSDFYAYIMPGQTCKIEVVGWRLPFFSLYKNILKATCN